MWTSKITSKQYVGGKLMVSVGYYKGQESFTETYDMSGGTVAVLNRRIKDRLDNLNDSDTLDPTIATGDFLPVVPDMTAQDSFMKKLRRLQSAKRAIDLGLITNASPLYTNAVTAVVNAFDPAFIDLI